MSQADKNKEVSSSSSESFNQYESSSSSSSRSQEEEKEEIKENTKHLRNRTKSVLEINIGNALSPKKTITKN